MGIYGEVPRERYQGVLDPYRDSAPVIEFRGHDVSLTRLSDVIVKLALTSGMESRHSLGVSTKQGGKS